MTISSRSSSWMAVFLSLLVPAQGLAQASVPPPPPTGDPAYGQPAPPPPADAQPPTSVTAPTPPPAQAPPPPPSAAAPVPPSAAPPQRAPAPAGQWVYTQQYGWVFMTYADSYTYVPPNGTGEPLAYVYYPAYGWRWVVAPWVWGIGPWPYFGSHGPVRFVWYQHGWWRTPSRWHFRAGPIRGEHAERGIREAPRGHDLGRHRGERHRER